MKTTPTQVSLIPATELAKMLGVRTATLAYWRRKGKGPQGWTYAGETVVVYPVAEVEAFIAERQAKRDEMLALARERAQVLVEYARRRKELREAGA